jgi:hypothetical protein
MLLVQIVMILVTGPCAAAAYPGARIGQAAMALAFAVLVVIAAPGRITMTIAVIATLFTAAGAVIDLYDLSFLTTLINHTGSMASLIVVAYVVGRAVLAPGAVNLHRVRGAVVLYLDLGMILATMYRLLWDLSPGSFGGIPAGTASWKAAGSILYFSFVTLTTVGFGDVVPIHPLARGLANIEGIIGQLYPATILARLISLQLEGRDRTKGSPK